MIHTLKFNELSALCLDFVDHSDGFFYLRLVGSESGANAIWAVLSAREGRGRKWGSPVTIPLAGRSYPEYVATQKGATYRTLRTRLPGGMIDLAMVHPRLTVAEDTERGFYLLTYEDGLPDGFFARLNRSLAIPLKPEWADWLWEGGQQTQTQLTLATRQVWEGGQSVEKTELTETTELPIQRLDSLGQVACYRVQTAGRYKNAWLQLIRQQLGLGIRLRPGGKQRYAVEEWLVMKQAEQWVLFRQQERLLDAPSLNYLLTAAREDLGLNLMVTEVERG